ncbi:hypothetical protein BD779DRAFT_1555083 [Infundibulicybe gibba]|nr:hypothetical protein BD779DRAFT_1555083 [Infundibulicybe gibba]
MEGVACVDPASSIAWNTPSSLVLLIWRGVYLRSSNTGLWSSFPALLRFLVASGVIAAGGPNGLGRAAGSRKYILLGIVNGPRRTLECDLAVHTQSMRDLYGHPPLLFW